MTSNIALTPPPSPQAPNVQLNISTISRILLWGSRRRQSSETSMQDEQEPPAAAAAIDTPQSPTKKATKGPPPHVACSSGTQLKTHSRLVDAHPECRQSDTIVHHDSFVCLDGVDTKRLLLLARRRVFEKVELLGGNAIIDERWECTICKQETRRGTVYKILITYQGTPARCTLPDPQRPVAMEEAKGVPGLMTVMSRQ